VEENFGRGYGFSKDCSAIIIIIIIIIIINGFSGDFA